MPTARLVFRVTLTINNSQAGVSPNVTITNSETGAKVVVFF